ncbi:MAG: hypothetical protein NT067_00185 [Candidatus Diapherotrites archaeon]|nr:hypothetical protein [Candidatus Diapherotrites archaeon]
MNSKGGLFTLAIGAMAIALLAVAIFSAQAMLWEEESEDYLAVMGDVKMAWANTAVVFDAAIGDAAKDTATCLTSGVSQAILDGYLTPAITKINSSFGSASATSPCSYSNLAITGAGTGAVTATMKIKCERILQKGTETQFKAKFEKSITFTKPC